MTASPVDTEYPDKRGEIMLRQLGFALLLCLLALSGIARANGPKKVIVVDSYTLQYPWSRDYRAVLQRRLGGRAHLSFMELDSKRLPLAQVAARAQIIKQQIAVTKPDLVIVGDDIALEYVGSQLDSSMPVVYLGINNNPRHYFRTLPRTVTGVLERPLITRSVLNLSQVVPGGIRHALVLLDDETTTRVLKSDAFYGYNGIRTGRISIDLQVTQSFERWQQIVATAPQRYQAIWIGLYFALQDAKGHVVDGETVARWTRAHSTIPVFGLWDFNVGPDKAVGGLVLTAEEQGVEAARIAEAVLFAGTPIYQIFPIIPATGRYTFSRAGVAHYRLKLEALPKQSIRLRD
jgi:hypothetical protein